MEDIHNGLTGEHHFELTVDSQISKLVLQQRGYRSVRAHELPDMFADYQKRDGLLIPIRTVRGEIESYQLKPIKPRIDKNGKPIKYETASNALQVIDVPPAAKSHLRNPAINMIITEGAKKVDAAVSQGLACTIGLQGVYGWRGKNEQDGITALADWEDIALNDRSILMAFDSDAMTKKEVRKALDRLGKFLKRRGANVSYLLMPDLPNGNKCGLDDWFAGGHTVAEFEPLTVTELPEIAEASPTSGTARANVIRMSEIEAEEIQWLWPGWIPQGMISFLGGYAGDGKSTLTASLVASLSTGAPLPDGSVAPITNCLVLPAEDDVPHVVKPRLQLHGADMERVFTLPDVDAGDGTRRTLNLRTDIPLIAEVVQKHEIGLIVIDPISGFTPGLDRNSEGEVRDSLQQLITFLELYRCAILGVMHMGKNSGHARSHQALMGSSAYTAVARSVLMLGRLPMTHQVDGEPIRNVLGVAKSNYAEAPMPLHYHRPKDQPIEYLGPSPMGLDAALNSRNSYDQEKGPNEAEKAEAWLLDFMDGERVLANAVEAAAKEEGFGETTIRKAKKKLRVESLKDLNKWYWLPPRDESIEVA